jgi:hypothetical protein
LASVPRPSPPSVFQGEWSGDETTPTTLYRPLPPPLTDPSHHPLQTPPTTPYRPLPPPSLGKLLPISPHSSSSLIRGLSQARLYQLPHPLLQFDQQMVTSNTNASWHTPVGADHFIGLLIGVKVLVALPTRLVTMVSTDLCFWLGGIGKGEGCLHALVPGNHRICGFARK